MNKVYLTEEQARVGIMAKMWTSQVIETAKKLQDGHLRDNYYLKDVDNSRNRSVSNTQTISK
jgi:hypothetical protein